MNEIIPFDFHGNEVRSIVDQDGNPWFVAKDVCEVLDIANNRDALSSLDEDEKNTVVITDGNRGNPNASIINESGLYSLILRSRKEEAKAFKKWITSEVLPKIRKTGKYESAKAIADNKPKEVADTQKVYRSLLQIAKLSGLKGNQAVLAANKGTKKIIGVEPLALVDAVHLIAEKQVRHLTPTQIGKELGLSGQKVNQLFKNCGLQVESIHGGWMPTPKGTPYAVLMDTGKARSDGTPVQQLKWTEDIINELATGTDT